MADTVLYLEGRSLHPNAGMPSRRGSSNLSGASAQSNVTTPSTATESEVSTPPGSPSHTSIGPSQHQMRPNSSHSSINSKLYTAIAPPPNAPLPALPPNASLIPFKPKLLPKRGLSRSPSPIVRTEPRQTYETKGIREEVARARELARSRMQQQQLLQQQQQERYLISLDEESRTARRARPAPIQRASSKLSVSSQDEATFDDLVHQNAHRLREPSLSPTEFNFLDGPLLLSGTPRRSDASSNNKIRTAATTSREPTSPLHQTHVHSDWQSGANSRSTEMALSHSELGSQPTSPKSTSKRTSRPKTAPQKRTNSSGDVIMRELGSSADEDHDEPQFERVTQARVFVPQRVVSSPRVDEEETESAWADDASIIDVDEQQYSHTEIAPEEVFEVAALRRQVEQLQMALKKQMAAKEGRLLPPSRSNTTNDSRYPFGMPTPDPSSRDGSSIGGATAFKASPSSSRSYREQHLAPSNFTHYGSSEHTSPSSRNSAALRSPQKQIHSDQYPFMEGYSRNHRIASDATSSILVDESASSYARDEDINLQDLARKINALEAMFKTSTLTSAPSSKVSSSQSSVAGSSQTQLQQHYPSEPSIRSARPRRASLATISTYDGGASNGRRSPAASAYNFNATSPYDNEQQPFKPSLMSRDSNGSSNSIDASARKGVARFIMGVGTSKGNIPRDEHGNPLPSMQVSWSRKRNEKIAKPQTKAKMTVGPGRGRIVLQPKP